MLLSDDPRGLGRVAGEGVERAEPLVGGERGALRVARGAAQARPGEAEPRVGARDRPVRAEREDRAAAPDVAPAEAGGGLLRPQPVAPVERARLVHPFGVQWLHRGGDALGGEPRHLGVAHRLQVLDPVRGAAARARVAVGVERRRHRAVADRVGRALEAFPRAARHHLGVAGGVGPERLGALAAGPRLEQPGGARVDHPVDEELGRAAAPAPAAAVALREQGRDLGIAHARLEQQRHDAAERQVPALLELLELVEQPRPPEHHVAAGEAERVQRAQRRGVGVQALGAGAPRHSRLHQLHRGRLLQLARRPAAVVAHHRRAGAERPRAVDPGQRERRAAGERRVVVEERQVRGRVTGRVRDRVGADRRVAEGVVGEAPAQHPRAGVAAGALGPERGTHLVEGPQPVEVGAARSVRAVERMDVAVDQARHQRHPAPVDQLGGPAGVRAHLGVVADGDDQAVADGDRGGVRPVRIQRADGGAEDGEIGSRHPWISGGATRRRRR